MSNKSEAKRLRQFVTINDKSIADLARKKEVRRKKVMLLESEMEFLYEKIVEYSKQNEGFIKQINELENPQEKRDTSENVA